MADFKRGPGAARRGGGYGLGRGMGNSGPNQGTCFHFRISNLDNSGEKSEKVSHELFEIVVVPPFSHHSEPAPNAGWLKGRRYSNVFTLPISHRIGEPSRPSL